MWYMGSDMLRLKNVKWSPHGVSGSKQRRFYAIIGLVLLAFGHI